MDQNCCSSVASHQNWKGWQFYCQFSEFVPYITTKLQMVAVLWPLFGVCVLCVNKTANPGSSMATFRSLQNAQSTRTANPGSSMATFRSLHQSGHKTANHGSSMATTFKIIFSPQNCKPWQFYGHFSESIKSGHKTANPSSSMATFRCL